MKFKLGLAQSCHPANGNVIELVSDYVKRAKDEGVDLLVFPESLMSAYEMERSRFLHEAEPLNGPFAQTVNEIARENGIWIVYTMNEKNDSSPDALPFNTAVVVDGEGIVRGKYRKTHMFDTDYTQESSRMACGDTLFSPIDTPFGKIGLAICYDLRFPEIARSAALQGCELMIYTAAWVDGPLKAHQWRTLLSARAIENEMFVAGVSRADEGKIGQSCIADPRGAILAQGGPNEELVCATIDTREISEVRQAMPVLEHRRPELYSMN